MGGGGRGAGTRVPAGRAELCDSRRRGAVSRGVRRGAAVPRRRVGRGRRAAGAHSGRLQRLRIRDHVRHRARGVPMNSGIEAQVLQPYKYGFVTDIESEVVPPGLSEDVIRLISRKKGEPEWMLEWRLRAYHNWLKNPEPHSANVRYGPGDYQAISYYPAPKQPPKVHRLDQGGPQRPQTVPKLRTPLQERRRLTC